MNTINGFPSSLGGGTRTRLLGDLGIQPREKSLRVRSRPVILHGVVSPKVGAETATPTHSSSEVIGRMEIERGRERESEREDGRESERDNRLHSPLELHLVHPGAPNRIG